MTNLIKAALVAQNYPQWRKNMFFSGKPSFGFKSDIYHYSVLKSKLMELGIDLSTEDINDVKNCKLIVCFDQAHLSFPVVEAQIKYLIIHDTFVYQPANWNIVNHLAYNKIFIWNKDVVDDVKYFHYNLPFHFEDYPDPRLIELKEYQERKLSVMVTSEGTTHRTNDGFSLAHERFSILHWFAENHPNDFHVFGRGWKEKIYFFRGHRYLKKILPFWLLTFIERWYSKRNLLSNIYGGEIGPLEKVSKIGEYNFYICYENTVLNDWITEKIFDCFAASCVPVYLGAPNINVYIPSNCIIDKRNFDSNEELYDYIKHMPYDEYRAYLKNIITFFKSKEIERFKIDTFVDTMISHIKTDLNLTTIIT